MIAYIRIVKELEGVYQAYQPNVGMVYPAEIRQYKCGKRIGEPFAMIRVKDKKIIVRKGEFEFVEGLHDV